jgi:hypothetical protein
MPSSEGTDERQLSSHDRSSDDPGELLGVLSRIAWMSTFDPQHFKHGLLRSKDSASADGPDLNAGHRHSHMKILSMVGAEAKRQPIGAAGESDENSRFHKSHAVRTFHVLGRVLSGGEEDGGEDVGGVSIKSTNATGHGAPNKILLDV